MGRPQIETPNISKVTSNTAAGLTSLMDAYGKNILPYEQSLQNAENILAPQEYDRALSLFDKYAGAGAKRAAVANQYQNEIDRQQGLAAAGNELAIIQGPGQGLAQESINLSKLADPEYYKTRELSNAAYQNLVGSIDPNKLTGSESAEIERNLNRMGDFPGGSSSWKHAITFGNALNQKKDRLASVLSSAPGLLQASRSGVDPFLAAARRSSNQSQTVTGNQILPSVNFSGLGNAMMQQGGNIFNQMSASERQRAAAQTAANQEGSGWNRAQQAVGMVGSLAGSVAGI